MKTSKQKVKNIGIDVKDQKKKCTDINCPFHGKLKIRGRSFVGTVFAANMSKTATVEWKYRLFVPKYERSETRRSKIHAHNPPCINAKVGDIVKIAESRQLSKTKNFVIIEVLGKEKIFKEKLAAIEESKVKEKEEPSKEEINKQEAEKQKTENKKEDSQDASS